MLSALKKPLNQADENKKYRHIVKLLDEEDRHNLFVLLLKLTNGNKKQTASIMGVTVSNIDHSLDERRKKPYVPSSETTARIFEHLVKVAAKMEQDKTADVISEDILSMAVTPDQTQLVLTESVLEAVKVYKIRTKYYDIEFLAALYEICQKVRLEYKIIFEFIIADQDFTMISNADCRCSDHAKDKKLQAIVLQIEQLKMRTDKMKKLCVQESISEPKNTAILEFITQFPEDKWLFLLKKISTHQGISVVQLKGMLPIWGLSNPQ